MKNKGWLAGLVGVASLGYLGAGALIYRNVTQPNTSSHKDSKAYDIAQGSFTEEEIEALPIENITIRSEMGYPLYAKWIPAENPVGTIVLVHGITSTIYGAMKYYKLYWDLNFNILAYDHRNHGKSGGTETTLGYHEKRDLETCVQWVRKTVGEEGIIGTHGESMGGGTVIQHGGSYDSVDFIVADCPFADLNRELIDVSKRDHPVPMWLALPAASLLSKFRGNGWYREASPIRVIGNIEVPLMIVHGDSDTYITPDHAQDLYDAKTKGVRKLYFAKGADHALSIIKDRDNYVAQVTDFLEDINVC